MVSGSSSRKRNDSYDDEDDVDESIGFNVTFGNFLSLFVL